MSTPHPDVGRRAMPCDRYPKLFRETMRGTVVGEYNANHWLVLWDGRKEPEALHKEVVDLQEERVQAAGKPAKGKRK